MNSQDDYQEMGALCPSDLLGQSQLYNGPGSNPFLDPNQTN